MKLHANALLAAVALIVVSGGTGAAATGTAVVTATVNLRAAPGTQNQVVGQLPPGAIVEIQGCEGDWCAVVWQGQSGFAHADYLDTGDASRPGRYAGGYASGRKAAPTYGAAPSYGAAPPGPPAYSYKDAPAGSGKIIPPSYYGSAPPPASYAPRAYAPRAYAPPAYAYAPPAYAYAPPAYAYARPAYQVPYGTYRPYPYYAPPRVVLRFGDRPHHRWRRHHHDYRW